MKREDNTNFFSKEQKKNAVVKIQKYVEDNFEVEIGNLQAEMFLDYITENIGMFYYNKAVADSMSFMTEKVEELYMLMKDEE